MAGFNTAISGIRAATTSLDVTGNNIANASTTGFKSSRTEFADIYATAAIGSGASNVPGSGVLVSDIAQDFSGGNVQFTNNNLDLSIDGSGFFQLDDGRGNVSYTRDGSFELDKNGFIISKSGSNLQGYGVDDKGNRLPIDDLQVSEKESPPKATETMGLAFNINEALDAEALIVPYSREESGSHTFSTTVGTFDSLGNEHTIRYDMVEQQARKEVHTFTSTNPGGPITISGFTGINTSAATFAAQFPNGHLDTNTANTPNLQQLQLADPRIFDVEYDNVASDQRRVIYQQRNEILEAATIESTITNIREDVINESINEFIPPQSMVEQWDVDGLEKSLETEFATPIPVQQWLEEDKSLYEETLRERIAKLLNENYLAKATQVGEEMMRNFEKRIMLQIIDHQWKEHLATMDHLRQGIHLRGYAQKNPKQEYKRESFDLFKQLLHEITHETVRYLSHVQFVRDDEVERMEEKARTQAASQNMQFEHETASALTGSSSEDTPEGEQGEAITQPFVRDSKKVGRNDQCPCGSGKKFKQCHGKLA